MSKILCRISKWLLHGAPFLLLKLQCLMIINWHGAWSPSWMHRHFTLGDPSAQNITQNISSLKVFFINANNDTHPQILCRFRRRCKVKNRALCVWYHTFIGKTGFSSFLFYVQFLQTVFKGRFPLLSEGVINQSKTKSFGFSLSCVFCRFRLANE